MSYFDDASLVMIPSGYKTSKVYSVKPTDGTGDLTFTRSNDTATRVGPDGLIEKVRTNLAAYSEQFDNAYWSKSNITVTANSTTNPINGATTADTLTCTGVASGFLNKQIAQTGIVTFSIFAKAGTTDLVRLNTYDGSTDRGAIYNLTTGAVSGAYGSPLFTLAQSFGNGWYRISIAVNAASYSDCQVHIDSVNSVIIYGAQLETGDIATDYIATTTAAVSVGPVANVPRLDYLNSSCPKLILEGQRTNLANWSEQANQYTKVGATIGSNVVTSPDGYTNADSIIEDGSTGGHAFYNFGITTFSAVPYTASIFAKKGGRNWFSLSLYDGTQGFNAFFNLNTGVVGTVTAGATTTITNYGNGWYRCTITATTLAGSTGGIAIYSANADSTNSYAGTNGLTAGYFYGWQLEVGAYATSYIPTLGAAVTRGVDFAKKENIAGTLPTAYPFTIFAESDFYLGSDDFALSFIDITTTNTYYTVGTFGNKYIGVARSSAGEIVATSSVNYTAGMNKVAAVFTSNSIKVFANGALVATATNTLSFTSSVNDLIVGTLREGADLGTRNSAKQILVFPSALSDADAIALTA